jgi:transposase
VHDKFHVVKYLNKGIDETRKKEVKEAPILKRTKYLMLKNSESLSDKERARFMEIEAMNLRTSKAWKMRENFMELFEKEREEEASAYFDRWYESVMKSNLDEMKEVAKTLKNFKEGIVKIVKYKITNGRAERFNGKIERLNIIAQGYKDFNNLRTAILFYNGKLDLFSHN